MMITANNGFIKQSERYAFNNAGESLKKYILLEKGELAYNHGASKLRPYGSCFALTIAEKRPNSLCLSLLFGRWAKPRVRVYSIEWDRCREPTSQNCIFWCQNGWFAEYLI